MRSPFRIGALSLWAGGMSALVVTSLRLAALNQADESILGLAGSDYARWSIFPILLILYGLAALHRYQGTDYQQQLGRIGFVTTFTGYALLAIGSLWSEVLFPSGHPFRFVGPNLGQLGLLVVVGGWAVWGVASYRARSLPWWAAPVPFVIALVWVTGRFYLSDFLDDVFWMGDAGLIQAVNALGLGLLGVVLWRGDGMKRNPAPTSS